MITQEKIWAFGISGEIPFRLYLTSKFMYFWCKGIVFILAFMSEEIVGEIVAVDLSIGNHIAFSPGLDGRMVKQ